MCDSDVCAVRVASGRPLQTPVIQNDRGERERETAKHMCYLVTPLTRAITAWRQTVYDARPAKADAIAIASLLPAVRRNVEAKSAHAHPPPTSFRGNARRDMGLL